MSHSKITAQDFIQNAFSPIISVICSPLVEVACRKNNLSFAELLQPFCRLNVEAQIRDPANSVITIKNLRMNLVNLNSQPVQPAIARKYLNSSVSSNTDIKMSTIIMNDYNLEIPASLPWFDMWRETFLEVQYPSEHEFTKHILACLVVVSSSEEKPLDCINQMLQSITQLQNCNNTKYPKWFNGNTLRYFIVVHDTVEGSEENAIKSTENLKQAYGANNCFLLQMNSRCPGLYDEQFLPDPWSQFLVRKTSNVELSDNDRLQTLVDLVDVTSLPSNVSAGSKCGQNLEIGQEVNEVSTNMSVTFHPLSPDVEHQEIIGIDEEETTAGSINFPSPIIVHGACLTTGDIEQLKLLIHEFYLKALLPYVEKQIQRLNDIISNKKGVSKSIFSATKRWFTPNKLGSSTAINTVIYADDSPEVQLRKLGDLYFMFGHYSMAFQVYHSAKRDFQADQAWLYYAGALEMAALSAFMCGEMTRKAYDYMEESIVTYLYTCRLPQFATRVTLFSTECLKEKGQYGDAAHQFIRMTSEDSDLRSALLLEQAAYCFLHCNKPKMVRKYAFHIILAGHRFSKCLQRKHSLRCYRQAFQVYNGKAWNLAEDHIYFTIGRQASNLKQQEEAKDAFSKLLTPDSKQNAEQQTIFLREYLTTHSLLRMTSDQQKSLSLLPMPVLKSNETKILLGPQLPFSIPGRVPASGVSFTSDENPEINEIWLKLEQKMVQEAFGSQQMVFKPMVTLFSKHNSSLTKPIAIRGEPIQVLVHLQNTLQITLLLKNIFLLWQFTQTNSNSCIENECNDDVKTYEYIKTDKIQMLNIDPDCEEKLVLTLTPLVVGQLVITGVCYTIVNDSGSNDAVGIIGKQNFHISGLKSNAREKDGQVATSQDKRLTISVVQSAPCLQVGFSEINQELLCNELQNVTIELRNCGTTPLHKIMMSSSVPHLFSLSTFNNSYDHLSSCEEKEVNKNNVIPIQLPPHLNNRLEPGQSHVMNVWMRAPSTKGTAFINLMFYYENLNAQSIPRYRLVKHLWHFSLQDSVHIEMNTRHSHSCNNVETLTFSLRATNSNHIHHAAISEITLQQATLMSYDWKLSQDAFIPEDVKLQSQESVNFLLVAHRRQAKSVQISNLLLSDREHKNDQKQQRSINIGETNIYFECFEKLKRNYSYNIEAMLILGWQAFVTDSAANKRSVIGQHYIPVKNIDKIFKNQDNTINLFIPQCDADANFSANEVTCDAKINNQITYSVAHLPVITHNFVNDQLCIVPVTLILYSRVNTDLIVKVTTRGTSSDVIVNKYKNDLINPNSSNWFRWMGHSEFIQHMKTFSSCQLKLHIAVACPGTYDLGEHIEVSCTKADSSNDFILQSCRIQNALIIQGITEICI